MALLQLSFGILAWVLLLGVGFGCASAILILHALTISHNTPVPKWRPRQSPIHLLIVLGSGGHTAEMLSMLRRMRLDPTQYTHRTYIVSSGDNFSAAKAVEYEKSLLNRAATHSSIPSTKHPNPYSNASSSSSTSTPETTYTIVTVPRARRVHQSYLTAPFSTLYSFWSCLLVLRGLHPDQKPLFRSQRLPSPYPDLILTNGPATAVCVILAARLLRLYHHCTRTLFPEKRPVSASPASASASAEGSAPLPTSGEFRLRTIFVESWARVTTLSLSGRILLPFADRFLVQWPALQGRRAWVGMRRTEYVGTVV